MLLLIMALPLRACLWSTSQTLKNHWNTLHLQWFDDLVSGFLDETITAEGFSSCRGNQHRTEIIDHVLAPRTIFRCLVVQGGSSENADMNIRTLQQPF